MKTSYIRNRFEKNGYKVVTDMSGTIVVTDKHGFSHSFNSLNEAYKYYFANH